MLLLKTWLISCCNFVLLPDHQLAWYSVVLQKHIATGRKTLVSWRSKSPSSSNWLVLWLAGLSHVKFRADVRRQMHRHFCHLFLCPWTKVWGNLLADFGVKRMPPKLGYLRTLAARWMRVAGLRCTEMSRYNRIIGTICSQDAYVISCLYKFILSHGISFRYTARFWYHSWWFFCIQMADDVLLSRPRHTWTGRGLIWRCISWKLEEPFG